MPNQRVLITAFGGPEVLRLVEEAQPPAPGPSQVRVKVLAAGTGFTDTIVRRGNYVDVKDKPPFVPGYDVAGTIDALGPGVHGFVPGQPVVDMPVTGGYQQYLLRPADSVVAVPEGIDPVRAACLPLTLMTAWQMLVRTARCRRGQRILVIGASGATGSAILAVGRHLGLEMIGTCSAHKAPLLQAYGCTAIDYRNSDFVAEVKRLTGNGVDAVFDAIGGAHWSRSYRCLRRGGILVGYGAQNIARDDDSIAQVLLGFAKLMAGWKLLPDGHRTAFYNIQHRRRKHPGEYREDLAELFELLRNGAIAPEIAATYPLDQAAEVHRQIDAGAVSGKIVLLPFPQEIAPSGARP